MANPMKFFMKKDKAGEWRWNLKRESVKGEWKIVADSGEGYKNYQDCRDEIEQIKEHSRTADISISTE